MASLNQAANVVWALNVAIQLVLLFLLTSRKEFRRYPAFCSYLAINLLQSGLFVFLYSYGSYHSRAAWELGWISQGMVVIARAVAAVEVCRHVLRRYQGIWALGSRLLAGTGAAVLLVAVTFGRHDLRTGVVTLDLGTELAIAAVMAVLFAFARHYDIFVEEPMRSMGVGFCLYSSFYVLNDLFLQHFLADYAAAWSIAGTVTFLGSLLLWTWAFLSAKRVEAPKPAALLEEGFYEAVMPEMNRRLLALNKQLGQLWRAESRHS